MPLGTSAEISATGSSAEISAAWIKRRDQRLCSLDQALNDPIRFLLFADYGAVWRFRIRSGSRARGRRSVAAPTTDRECAGTSDRTQRDSTYCLK